MPLTLGYIGTFKLYCFLVIDVDLGVVWRCGMESLNYDLKSWQL